MGETHDTGRAAACAAAEHRQFDFWIGAWEVFFAGTSCLAGIAASSRPWRLRAA